MLIKKNSITHKARHSFKMSFKRILKEQKQIHLALLRKSKNLLIRFINIEKNVTLSFFAGDIIVY